MKTMKYTKYALAAVLLAACLLSCKKDKDSVSPSLSGGVRVSIPGYVFPGDVIKTSVGGVYRDDESDTLLMYTCYNSITGKSDTLRREGDPASVKADFEYTVPDTIGRFYFSFTAWAKGYTSKYSTQYFYVVDTTLNGSSISGYVMSMEEPAIDSRDGRRYPATSAGSQKWMMTNLAWEGAGEAYQGAPAASRLFGRYYTWNEASSFVCPDGWHLPTDAEWTALAESAGATSVSGHVDVPDAAGRLMGKILFYGDAMWGFAKDVKISNDVNFCAIPVGYAKVDPDAGYSFEGYGSFACFWTADEFDSQRALVRYIYWDKPSLSVAAMPKDSYAASVRCVK